ncbi:inositol monophosphatase family protein [Delftia acidovorans]|uniref:inositol monophosphatase family protein n=1 Tax=Delftia acidovorans TaxID=80866 RepID=UPI000BCF0CD6|nr:inositol monophosphatase family protein [Delftia acidovorans]SOE39031.1 myo-inositol-1(or 4)-monophosphatase [Delftia acidovorans]
MNIRSLLEGVSSIVFSELHAILEKRYRIRYKQDGSPVTDADVYVENIIENWLGSRIEGLVFIGEESHDQKAVYTNDCVAILDPIDGTENFCSGLKEWGTSLGIWRQGQHLGSMLLMPELGWRLMTGDKVIPLQSRITGFSSSMNESILLGMKEPGEYRITGCAVYNFYNVITGSFKRFVNPKGAHAWDLLPGLMLALENQCGVIVDDEEYHGSFLQPDRKYRIDIRR